jgi:hypothetical protein
MNLPDLDLLADAFSSPEWTGARGAECPNPARVWEAACGRLATRDLGEVADHAARCPRCAQELRAARRVAEQIGELAPFRAPQPRLHQLAERVGEVVSRAMAIGRQARSGAAAGTPAAWRPLAVTAAVAAAACVAVLLLLPAAPVLPPGLSQPRADVAAGIVPLLVPDGRRLPRDDFVLRWQELEGARYDVRVMTTDLDEIAVVTDLKATELRLGEELAGLAAGTTLLWQVEAYLPSGERVPSLTFRAQLE